MALPICIIPNCGKLQSPVAKYKLCLQCYSKAKKMVESGRTTWEKLVEMGLAQDTDNDPFTDAFNKLTKET